MEQNHPINDLMSGIMEKIRDMVSANTIIGEPIRTDEITLIPVSKLSFGFASGGSDFASKNQKPDANLFGGGGGAGVNIQPVAFLVVKNGCVRTIQLSDPSNSLDRALTMLPELIDKVGQLIKSKTEPPQTGGQTPDGEQ